MTNKNKSTSGELSPTARHIQTILTNQVAGNEVERKELIELLPDYPERTIDRALGRLEECGVICRVSPRLGDQRVTVIRLVEDD